MILHNFHFSNFDAFGYQAEETVHSVHLDRKQRLWIGSEKGLHLFDGTRVTTFEGKEDSPEDIPHYFAKAITETPQGDIWIGTWGGGITRFNEVSRSFFKPDLTKADQSHTGFDQKVWSLESDEKGRIWIGTFTTGLFRYTPESNAIARAYAAAPGEYQQHNRIQTIYADDEGRIWFAPSGKPVRVIDADSLDLVFEISPPPKLDTHPRLRTVDDISPIPGSNNVMIAYDRGLVRIVSSEGVVVREFELSRMPEESSIMEGLALSDRAALMGSGSQLWYLNLDNGDHFAIPTGEWKGAIPKTIIWDMDLSDSGDILVAGTTGVWIQPYSSRQFWTIYQGGDAPSKLHEARAISKIGDSLYINDGSDIFEIPGFPEMLDRPSLLNGFRRVSEPDTRALSLVGKEDWGIWGGSDEEPFYLDRNNEVHPLTPSTAAIHTMLLDEEFGRVLVPSFSGLLSIDPAKPQIAKPSEKQSESQPTTIMAFGNHGDIWTGTFSGIHRFDRSTLEPLSEFSEGADAEEWTAPFTNFVEPVSQDTLLIGGSDGLFKAVTDSSGEIKSISRLLKSTILGSAGFSAIYKRDDGKHLLVTNRGLVEFSPESEAVKLLPSERVASFLNPYGGGFFQYGNTAILSGLDGPLLFDVNEIQFDFSTPQLNIAEIASFRENTPVSWPLDDSIEFEYVDKVIRFKFGLLDYLKPEDNSYRVRLIGFTDDWIAIDSLSEFSFTNLDADSYTLEIEGRDGGSGRISRSSLEFSVLPPWWQTWWAYTLYVILIVGSIVGYIFYLQRKLAREKEISEKLREADRVKSNFVTELEKRVDEATADMRHALSALEVKNVELEVAQHRAQDASRLKSEFLANMSHEIRTPMNGVLGFTQLLKKSNLDTDQEEYVETLESSAHSLLGIINDILDLSKIEAGKLIIDSTGFNLRTCALETLETLAPVAYEKGLELALEIDSELPPGMRGDPVRMRQVVTNLVGNAIKFTEEGTVAITLRPARLNGADAMEIEITDTGRGITEEDRRKLFSAFERGKAEFTSSATGTGLGLVITKKLTEAMGGEIDLDSVPGEGTRVTLRFPLTPDRNPENRYEAPQPLLGKTIHLVDTNEASRAALFQQLRTLGADVIPRAEPVNSDIASADIVAIGISRQDSNRADEILARLRERLGPEKPLLVFMSRTDRSVLRELGDKHDALCLPKIANPAAQVRRIEDWLRGGEQPSTASSGSQHVPTALEGLEILVADDNRINRYFLRKMLETHGASVHEAIDGREALALLGDGVDFDLALIDLHMPEVDGLELAEKARAADVRTPLIVVSANVLQETREAAQAAGFDDYILKPVEEAALLEVVRRHL